MTLDELIYRYRLEARDREQPYLTSSDDVTMWLNDAYRQAAIRGRLIREDTLASVCEIDYVVGQATYTLHPSVVEIISLRIEPVASPTRPRALVLRSREWMDSNYRDWRTEPHRWPDYAIQDDTSIRLVSPYLAGDVLKLECYRTPLDTEKLESGDSTPIINVNHHEHLVDWAMHKVFSQVDTDLFDPQRAADAERRFTAYFGPLPDSDMRRNTRTDQVHRNTPYF